MKKGLSDDMFGRQKASAAFNQGCRASDVRHLTISEGTQLIVFASAPATALLICLTISMTR